MSVPLGFGRHSGGASELPERRRFIIWAASVAALSACSSQVDSLVGPPTSAFPTTGFSNGPSLNVRDYGAVGDGVTDDTDAFARALGSLVGGGTLVVPDGDYLINPLKSVRLTDDMTLSMSPSAILRAIPVAARNSAVVLIERSRNVRVTGGTIIGERNGHLGTGGEGGMGIWVCASSDVRIQNVTAQDCWGDGFYVAGRGDRGSYAPDGSTDSHSENVTISGCLARNNRRQGLSIVGCTGALVENSEFSDTSGTAPQSGIDVEPQGNWRVKNVTIRNCITARNAGWGIMVCANDIYNGQASHVTIENNRCVDNGVDGAYVRAGATDCLLTHNVFARNQNCGVVFGRAFANELTSNVLRNNSRQAPGSYPDILVSDGSSHNTITGNRSDSQRSLFPAALPSISIMPDCFNNVVDNVSPLAKSRSRVRRSG
jgi:parallel beta-helix repeat protein